MSPRVFLEKLWLFVRQAVVYRLVVVQRFRLAGIEKKLTGFPLVFVTVAFNDARLIRLQLEALGRFVTTDFRVLVIDNSLSPDARAGIHRACDEFDAVYIRGPWNLFSLFQGSLSHSSTLDWAWRGLIRQLGATTIALLDHDLFPVAAVTEESLLRGSWAAGREERRAGMWYLWPGLLVMKLDRFRHQRFSFMPYRELDSAGGLWVPFYSRFPKSAFTIYERDVIEVLPGTRAEDSSVEVIDQRWVHLIDGSGWLDGTGKFERVFGGVMDSNTVNWDGVVAHLKSLGVSLPRS